MTRARPGKTLKISVSLSKDDAATLRRHARVAHDGNLSAAIADAAKWIRQSEARARLVDLLGGSVLTPASEAGIAAELALPATRKKATRPRSRRAA